MDQPTIQRLIHDYGPVRWVDKSIFGFKNEGWFVIDTIPLPPKEEIESVVMDIIHHQDISYANGKVRRWPENQKSSGIKDRVLKEVVTKLENKRYKVGICVNENADFLEGQPIAIALDPIISYMNYPDHPHLNTLGQYKNAFVPESFCYGYNVEKERYGTTDYEKFMRAFDEVTLWLFRHQIWEAYREYTGKGKWIGVHHAVGLPDLTYAGILNPLGQCRCGKKLKYLDCHLPLDLSVKVKEKMKLDHTTRLEVQTEYIKNLTLSWDKRVGLPQREMLKKLKDMLT